MAQGKKTVFVSYVKEDSDMVDRICQDFRKSGIVLIGETETI
jgi:hypothetical protein